jgi:hypothetical protein
LVTAAACLLGAVGFVGCSADGASADPLAEEAPNEPNNGLPPSSSGGDPSPTDGGTKKDSGKKDAEPDAGPPPPEPGDPCTELNKIVEKTCGACGEQSAVCLQGDAGTGFWSVYSACTGETVGGCIPGSTVTEECGNCGTRVRTCSKYCALSNPQCTGQPTGSCPAGSVDLTSAGCTTPATYLQRSCKADCTYNSFGGTCEAPPTTVTMAKTTGSVSSTVAVLKPGQVLPKLAGTCPNATVSATLTTPYVYIQVTNPLPKAAKVSIYNALAPNGVVVDTTLAAYAGAVAPTVEAARKTCEKGPNSYGTAALTGDSKFGSLDNTRMVTIPANGTVSVYVAADKAYDAAKPAESTGPVKLSVKTEQILEE